MTNYEFGDILLLRFPYSDGRGATKRPVLILAQTDKLDVVVAKITSTEKRSDYDFEIKEWDKVGLLFPSIVRIDKLATLSISRVIRRLGTLNNLYDSIVKDKITQLFKIK